MEMETSLPAAHFDPRSPCDALLNLALAAFVHCVGWISLRNGAPGKTELINNWINFARGVAFTRLCEQKEQFDHKWAGRGREVVRPHSNSDPRIFFQRLLHAYIRDGGREAGDGNG